MGAKRVKLGDRTYFLQKYGQPILDEMADVIAARSGLGLDRGAQIRMESDRYGLLTKFQHLCNQIVQDWRDKSKQQAQHEEAATVFCQDCGCSHAPPTCTPADANKEDADVLNDLLNPEGT